MITGVAKGDAGVSLRTGNQTSRQRSLSGKGEEASRINETLAEFRVTHSKGSESVGLCAGLRGKFALQPTFDSLGHDRDVAIAVIILQHLVRILNQNILRTVAVENYPAGARNHAQVFV